MSNNTNTHLDEKLAAEIEAISDDAEKIDKENKLKERNQKNTRTIFIIIGVVFGLALLAAIGLYIYNAGKYKTHFFKGTFINGIDASDLTADDIRTKIQDQCKNYSLVIKARGREDEIITAKDVELHYSTDDSIESLLAQQNQWEYIIKNRNITTYEVPSSLVLDDKLLTDSCYSLLAFDDSTAYDSENAYIGEYDPAINGYPIIAEINSNKIVDKNGAIDHIKAAMLTLNDSVNLDDDMYGLYGKAEICSDNEGLVFKKKNLDKFVGTKITFAGSDIILDGNTISEWVVENDLGVIEIDEDKLSSFVQSLANEYDTVGTDRILTSWWGNETTVGGGTFGWQVNQKAEIDELKRLIPETTIISREPIFSKRGVVHKAQDWGDTYVEINLAKQHLFYIKKGELVIESDIVSGGHQRKDGPTPTGIYQIAYKARDAVLRGPRDISGNYSYETPVSYWMPFNKGIGLHDANWRWSFGGKIYLRNGSHGCINLPVKVAKTIYENIEPGIPVIVYDDDFEIIKNEEQETETETKTVKKKTNTQPVTKAATQTETQATTEVETQPETEPETQASTETSTLPIPAISGEIGPGVSTNTESSTAEPEIGPGVSNPINTIENVPGAL